MQRRPSFTLVEMMVAMALIVFIMVILSEAFVAGLESFRQLKAIGDMDEKMRSATSILSRDLRADHFGDLSRPLSRQEPGAVTTAKGFFRVYASTPSVPVTPRGAWSGTVAYTAGDGVSFNGSNYISLLNSNTGNQPDTSHTNWALWEGADGDAIPSTYATGDMLHFTVDLGLTSDTTLHADRRENFLTANLFGTGSVLLSQTQYTAYPNTVYTPPAFQDAKNYYGQWAEVAWFLRATGADANGQPLYALYRRQRVVPDQNSDPLNDLPPPGETQNYQQPAAALPSFQEEVPCTIGKNDTGGNVTDTANLYFDDNKDIAAPCRRFGMRRLAPGANYYDQANSAGLLSDVDPLTQLPSYPILTGPNRGSDLVLTDVLSFDVKVSFGSADPTGANGDFLDLWDPRVDPTTGTQFQRVNPAFSPTSPPVYGGVIPNPRVYDTWCAGGNTGYYDYIDPSKGPNNWKAKGVGIGLINSRSYSQVPTKNLPSIRAIQVILRVWDRKTSTTRQITLVQEM